MDFANIVYKFTASTVPADGLAPVGAGPSVGTVMTKSAHRIYETGDGHNDVITNGNIFRVTGHLCMEFTGPRWIPHTKASDAELWCFLWSVSE